MFVSLQAADRLDGSFQDHGMNTERFQHSDDDLQVAQLRVCVHGRSYEITVLIRVVSAHPTELLPQCGGRRIPVMTVPLRTSAGISSLG